MEVQLRSIRHPDDPHLRKNFTSPAAARLLLAASKRHGFFKLPVAPHCLLPEQKIESFGKVLSDVAQPRRRADEATDSDGLVARVCTTGQIGSRTGQRPRLPARQSLRRFQDHPAAPRGQTIGDRSAVTRETRSRLHTTYQAPLHPEQAGCRFHVLPYWWRP
jgi:hypothetical protein